MPRFEIPDVRGETRDIVNLPSAGDAAAALDAANAAQAQADAAKVVADAAKAQATAVAASMPKPATTAPIAEKTAAVTGSGDKYSRDDHAHPRLTSTTQGVVASGNTATVAFTRTFASEPGIDYQELPATAGATTPDAADTAAQAQPTTSKVIAWTKDGQGNFTGCTVRVWKSQTVPQNLATLLLGGVFNLFAATVVGTRFSLIAVARSDVQG